MDAKKILWMVAVLSLAHACSATNVSVSLNNETFHVGETVEMTLDVVPTAKEGVGGQFILYEWVNNSYQFVRRLLVKPSPWQCPACSGTPGATPLRERYYGTFYFIPTKPGRYNADANFDGVKDSKNFTVLEKYKPITTTTRPLEITTTTLPKRVSCSEGGIKAAGTSEDTPGKPKLQNNNPEHEVGRVYSASTNLTEDEIRTSGFEKKTLEVSFYTPEDLGSQASVYVKAGTEDGLKGEINFTINGIVVGGCSISGSSTGGIQGRWGECTAQLDASLLKPGEVNTFRIVDNAVPEAFRLSFIDYDYMEFHCVPGERTTTMPSEITTISGVTTTIAETQPTVISTTMPPILTTTTEAATVAEGDNTIAYIAVLLALVILFALMLRKLR